MNYLKQKNKISKIKNTGDWFINDLDKEESRFAENLHTKTWNKNIENMKKSIRRYGILWKVLKHV